VLIWHSLVERKSSHAAIRCSSLYGTVDLPTLKAYAVDKYSLDAIDGSQEEGRVYVRIMRPSCAAPCWCLGFAVGSETTRQHAKLRDTTSKSHMFGPRDPY